MKCTLTMLIEDILEDDEDCEDVVVTFVIEERDGLATITIESDFDDNQELISDMEKLAQELLPAFIENVVVIPSHPQE